MKGLFAAVVAVAVLVFISQLTSDISLTQGLHSISSSLGNLFDTLLGNVWWVLLGIVLLPGLLGILMDAKGQSASGWLFLLGMGLSIALGLAYLAGLIIYGLFKLIAGFVHSLAHLFA